MRLQFLALAPAIAAPVCAQGPIPTNYGIDFDSVGPTTDVARIVAGEFNGTSMLDFAMLLDDDSLSVAFDAVLGEASATYTGTTFYDLAAYAPSGGAMDRDLLAVGPSGLQRVEWNMALGAFESADLFDPASDEFNDWTGATVLRTGDIDGNGSLDVVGVAANGQTLLAATDAGSGFVPILAGSLPALVPGTILDLTIVDGDGDGTREVALVSSAGLYWYDANGVLLADFPINIGSAEIETVSVDGQSTQNVAVLLRLPGGPTRIWIVDGVTHALEQNLNVSALNSARLTSGDHNGDGSTDLAVSSRAGDLVAVLLRQGSGYSLNGNGRQDVVISEPPSLSTMAPVSLADIDGDGDLDIAYPIAENGQIFMAKNGLVNHEWIAPRLFSHPVEPHVWIPWLGNVPGLDPELFCRFEVASPPASEGGGLSALPGATHLFPQGATHLDVRLWSATSQGGGAYATGSSPADQQAIPLADVTWITDFDGVHHFYEFRLDMSSVTNANLHYVTARYVELDRNSNVVRSWPHSTFYFVPEGDQQAQDYIEGFPFATPATVEVWSFDPFEPPNGGTKVGGGGGTGCVPDYPPSDPPADPPPNPADPPSGT